jgi:hypothetical protein
MFPPVRLSSIKAVTRMYNTYNFITYMIHKICIFLLQLRPMMALLDEKEAKFCKKMFYNKIII